MTNEQQARADADIVLDFANEMFALSRKRGLVVGGCYQTQAQAAIEIATRILRAAGLPDPVAVQTMHPKGCHWGGVK